MIFPLKHSRGIPIGQHPGAFGFKRSYYYHPGVDLYCEDGDEVFSMEGGIVVGVGDFTGASQGHNYNGHQYWEDTQYVAVKGRSGTIVYGEVKVDRDKINVGQYVRMGELIAHVKRVLPFGKERPDVPGHSLSMLHLELYDILLGEPVSWHHDEGRDKNLLDPTGLLLNAEAGAKCGVLVI